MPKRWPDDVREEAIRLAVAEGLPEASRATGVARPTIHGWLKERGLSAYSEQSDRQKTEAARTAADLAVERWRAGRRQLLAAVSLSGLAVTERRLRGGAEGVELREVVGAWTRAEHHLERMETAAGVERNGQVVVNFNVGRSGAAGPPVVPEASLSK